MHDCPADDDGYETAGKKELVPVRVKSGDKQGRKVFTTVRCKNIMLVPVCA